MKLIEQKTRLNPETFAPEVVITVAIPVDRIMQELNAVPFYQSLGQDLADCIKNGPPLTVSYLKM